MKKYKHLSRCRFIAIVLSLPALTASILDVAAQEERLKATGHLGTAKSISSVVIGHYKQHALELREKAAAFEVFKDGEVLAYAKCLSAHQAAGDDAAAQVAAYAPLFEGYKANAIRALSGVVCKIFPGDDDTQFLHDEMPVGAAGQPANRTRAGFIAWLGGKIDRLAITDAVSGIDDLHLLGVYLPKDGNGPEFTRFTTGLKKTIADVANLAVQELGRKNSESPFVTDEIKRALYVVRNPGISDADLEKDLPSYFPAEYSDDLRDMLYKAIKSI